MKIIKLSSLVFIFLSSIVFKATLAETLPPQAPVKLTGHTLRSDRVIVRFKDSSLRVSAQGEQALLFSDLGLKVTEVIRINKGITRLSGVKQNLDITILSLDGRKDLKTVLKKMNDHSSVLYAEPDYIVKHNLQPNDEFFTQLWGLDNSGQQGGMIDADIDAPEAWDTWTGSNTSVIGVIDTGIDYTHEDLAANMWINAGEIPNDGVDNDNNGYIDDIHGIDCINDDTDPMDDTGHGTHVAGTIGAVGNNGIGISGINWNTKMMALKFLGADGNGFISNAVECLAYAIKMKNEHGVDIRITNNSWGGDTFSQALQDTIQASADANMLFIAAAGNASSNTDITPHYPSSLDLDNIISVAATTRTDNLASFSNFGATTVDLGAPGNEIISTIPGNQYGLKSGTSMATPHVSGAAALLWSDNPSLSAIAIKNRLIDQAEKLLVLEDKTVNGRRLNIETALNCILGSPKLEILTPKNQFIIPTGEVIVRARLNDCGEPITNINIVAVLDSGDPSFSLFDDGQNGDAKANDGIYTGVWQVQNPNETVTLTINADSLAVSASVTGEVAKNYQIDSNHSFLWIDATAGTRLDISDNDDETEVITIGFEFEFYGVPYSEVNVDSNGVLTFGNGDSLISNAPIPDTSQPNGYIAPYWDDLNPAASGAANIYSFLEGSAPNRRLTIAWVETPLFLQTASDSPVTVEVTLYEGSNEIIFQYDGAYLADSATIGLEHQSGLYGIQYLYDGKNDGGTIQIQQDQAIRFFLEDNLSPDTVAPSIPKDLVLNNKSTTELSFSWTPSTDTQGSVALYHIIRDGSEIDASTVPSYTDRTVVAGTTYVYNLTAEDDSGNVSELSADLNVNTLVSSGPTLTAGYPFEEGADPTILDVSGNGNNGMLGGNAIRNAMGKIGSAIEFNGLNSYINLGFMDITSPNLSIAMWFKPDDFGIHDARLISKSTGSSGSAHYWMISTVRNNGQHRLRLRLKTANGGTSTLTGSAALTAGVWTHVTATYDGVAMKLFQDGIEVGSLAKTGAIATSDSVGVWIGANPNSSRYFDGLIDDVRIYGEALDIATIGEIIQGNFPLINNGDNEPPSMPGNLVAVATATQATLNWDPATDNIGVALYRISLDGNEIGITTETSFQATDLNSGQSYDFLVVAEDTHGNQSIPAAVSVTTQQPSDNSPPSIPTGLTLNGVTATAVSFSWTPSTDTQGSVALYHIIRNGSEIGTSTVPSYTDNSVQANTAYVYNLTAEDDSGNESSVSLDLNVNTSLPSGLDLSSGYPFEEGSGPAILDVSGNGNNGMLGGNAARNPMGKIGAAIEFNGFNSYINLGFIDITSPNLSIAMWFKPDDFGIHDARLISKSTGSSGSAHYWMISTVRNNGQHRLRLRLKTANGGTSTLTGSAALTAGVWTHVTATYDGVAMKLFQDGIEVGSLAKTGAIATSDSVGVWIGANPDSSRYFDGLIDDVRIYGEALDIATIGEIIQGNFPLINNADNEPPSMPGNLVAVATATQATLNWDPATDNIGVALYRISLDGNEIGITTETSFQATDLNSGQSYDFLVVAEDTRGNQSIPAAVSVTTQQPSDNSPPSVPTGLTLNGVTATAVSFSWTPSTDTQGSVALYHIIRNGSEIGMSTVPSYTDNTVQANTAYVYNLTAEDDSGNESAVSLDLNVNTSLPSGPNLTAGYPFEEGSGSTILDVSGNGNNGMLGGNAARNSIGKIGAAIRFNGTNSYVDLGSLNITGSAMSISLWFKADDFDTPDARLISKANGTAESAHYWMISTIRVSGQQKLRFRFKTNNGVTSTLIGNGTLNAGDWTHVTATYDGVAMKLFQNGVLVGSLAKTGTIATSSSVNAWIGANPGNARYFDGLIDDVRIYGEALDATTILDIIQGVLPLNN